MPLRYKTSLPSRFLLPLAAGVPIILPKNRFLAMERLVEREGIGYAYGESKEVYEMVTSPQYDLIWQRAKQKREKFFFDGKEFRNFLSKII